MSRVSLSASRLELVFIGVLWNVGAMLGGVIAPRVSMTAETASHMSMSVLLSTIRRMTVRKWSGFTEPLRTWSWIENNLTATLPLSSGEGRLNAAGEAPNTLARFVTPPVAGSRPRSYRVTCLERIECIIE